MDNKIIINGNDVILDKDRIKRLTQLNKNWKDVLKNDCIAVFKLDEYSWSSVSHYYEANKYKSDQEYYKQFTIESKSKLSKDLSYFDKNKLIDSNFYNFFNNNKLPNNLRILTKGIFSKFNQNKDLKKILLLTGNDQLWEAVGGDYMRLETLELVRKELKNPLLDQVIVDLSK